MSPAPGEDLARVQRRTWTRFDTGYRMRPPVTIALLVAITVVHLLTGWIDHRLGTETWLGVFGPRSAGALARGGGRVAVLVGRGEWWRLWTYGFLHADALHYLLNTVALVGLGRVAEVVYGSTRTLWLFLVSVITGGLLSQLGGNPASVGASGGLFGIMGALLVFGRRHRGSMDAEMRASFGKRLAPWVVLNLAVGLVIPSIDNLAHVGGLLGGVGFGLATGNMLTANADASPRNLWAMRVASALLLVGGMVGVIAGSP